MEFIKKNILKTDVNYTPAFVILVLLAFVFLNFSFSDITLASCHTSTGRLYGDINNDGRINVTDVELAMQASLGSISLNSASFEAADVNGDGVINVSDVTLINRYASGLIDTFPVCPAEPDPPPPAAPVCQYTCSAAPSCPAGYSEVPSTCGSITLYGTRTVSNSGCEGGTPCAIRTRQCWPLAGSGVNAVCGTSFVDWGNSLTNKCYSPGPTGATNTHTSYVSWARSPGNKITRYSWMCYGTSGICGGSSGSNVSCNATNCFCDVCPTCPTPSPPSVSIDPVNQNIYSHGTAITTNTGSICSLPHVYSLCTGRCTDSRCTVPRTNSNEVRVFLPENDPVPEEPSTLRMRVVRRDGFASQDFLTNNL